MTIDDAYRSVGKGWRDLIDLAFRRKPTNTTVIDVKEKWGQLRIYVDSSSADYLNYLNCIEDLSAYVCESCGDLGELREGSWIKVRCDECNSKRDI